MRNISTPLFNELRNQTARIATGWLVLRQDGQRFAFTSWDTAFVYDGDAYTPTNGFNPSAIVSKADLSVDNMECQVLDNEAITDVDLRAGVWDLATVKVFWICPLHPEWGIVPLRGGNLGEIVIKDGQWTTQLRSLFQQLQQPFGFYYTLQCMAQLGDDRCKVELKPEAWRPSTSYKLGLLTDAAVGTVVKPTTYNGFWYVANYTTRGPSEENYSSGAGQGLGGGGITGSGVKDPGNITLGAGGGDTAGGGGLGILAADATGGGGQYDASALRQPTKPGQGLSGNDDLGPNDDTQVAVGPPNDSLNQFDYTGIPVDIFGIKLGFSIVVAAQLVYYLCSQLHGGGYV